MNQISKNLYTNSLPFIWAVKLCLNSNSYFFALTPQNTCKNVTLKNKTYWYKVYKTPLHSKQTSIDMSYTYTYRF